MTIARTLRLVLAFLVLAAAWLPHAADAGQLKVSPIRLDLGADRPIGSVTIGNPSGEAVLLHLSLRAWNHSSGQDVFVDSRDVLLNPMIFELQPGEEQLVRIGLVRPVANEREVAYRLFIREVPNDRPQTRRIATYLNISLPLFVAPREPDAPILVWNLEPRSDGEVVLRVENRGNLHTQITSLALQRPNGEPAATIDRRTYVLAGQPREWVVPGDVVARGEVLTLTADSDAGKVQTALRLGPRGPDAAARE